MIKDTFFSMPRFVNFCRKDMAESRRTNVLRALLLYGVTTVIILWISYLEYSDRATMGEKDVLWEFIAGLFMFSLFGFGCLSASLTMEKMKSKTSRLAMLMIPATSFEKYLFRWLLSTVVFLAVFLIAFCLADYTRVLVFSMVYPELESIAVLPIFSSGPLTLSDKETVVLALFFFVQSCFVLGSTIWPKNAFLKTFVAGAIVFVVYALLAAWMSKSFYEEGTSSLARELPQKARFTLVSVFFYTFTLFNWVLGYFRFKESEIINRM